MSTTYHVLIPTNACIRGSKFKSVSMPGDASDIESLSSWSSSRLIKIHASYYIIELKSTKHQITLLQYGFTQISKQLREYLH